MLYTKNKKGNILTENIIFIVLNITFIALLMIFLFAKTGSDAVLEEKYAKQIALMIDAAEPGMTIYLNMEDAINSAAANGIPPAGIVKINDNIVTVKLRDKGGYSYSFFNNVHADPNPDFSKKEFYFVISAKQ